MLYRVIFAVCFEIHTKLINTLYGLNVELLDIKLALHIVTTGGTYSDQCVLEDSETVSNKIRFAGGRRADCHAATCQGHKALRYISSDKK
jgi:hypothetical protein